MPRLSNPLPEKTARINQLHSGKCWHFVFGEQNRETTSTNRPQTTGKLQNLSEIIWFAWIFVWLCVVSWQVTFEKCLNFHGLSRQETIASCLDRLSKLRHFPMFIAFKQHNRKPNKKTKCKPADFWKILQFTCMHRPYVSYVDLCAKDNCGLIYTHLWLPEM